MMPSRTSIALLLALGSVFVGACRAQEPRATSVVTGADSFPTLDRETASGFARLAVRAITR